jgi:hypothetical protein
MAESNASKLANNILADGKFDATDVVGNITSTGIDDNATSTAITIDSSENVGIGISPTPPTAYGGLHIHSTYPVMKLSATATGSGTGDGFVARIDSTPRVELWNYENSDMVFGTNNAERMRILAGGGLTFNGDTAAANALDDYEEGTWTPNIDTSGGTLTGDTYSVYNRGWYTRIGNTVTLSFALNLSNKGSGGSGAVRFTGFPFASTQTAASVQACVSTFNSGRTEPMNLYGTWTGGYQTIRYDNATGGGELNYSEITNSFTVSGQITMLV